MIEIPLPENVNIGFEPFCEGCKYCDTEILQQNFSNDFIICKHMSACESLYTRIKGEKEKI